jgi:hypothetical protein
VSLIPRYKHRVPDRRAGVYPFDIAGTHGMAGATRLPSALVNAVNLSDL